ncbi:uncharacterized protein LOC128732456 [Sabethes cyaneus]|uniref:uncharacterized protein LOC128732456 n=1 Tax=Sabethes cyaneus TaxID=53552 RepID=UPI00237EAE6E|nr:uncharacterized protein LOC128732456 [Sabethes cyaneus]
MPNGILRPPGPMECVPGAKSMRRPLNVGNATSRHYQNLQLHIFADASEVAYAAAAYFRITNSDGVGESVLVAAKTKVAPLKPSSIPRLELRAAVLGVRLMQFVEESHNVKIQQQFLWSDSITVLAWLRADHRKYKQFLIWPKWGKGPCQDVTGAWFKGPEFLKCPPSEWSRQKTTGGAWERMVRSIKTAMDVTFKSHSKLDDEALVTLVVEAEGLVNFRPLTYQPIVSEESEALTPNHFLLGSSNGVRQPAVESKDTAAALGNSYSTSWEQIQLHLDTFWRRWVNISNTWTLPQDGFSVFYRYFRDKISWFEADAVCQFHHANLVTVDNGVQFDAARAFLKELDVTSPVWIGLMRPENSARFTWTNAKSLDPSSGYWAESLPAIETPLCAVVDPVRDFRWHALRCGGPETASFLCELPVPNWATDCTVTLLPSLTVQYMSDSGAVQLSRDCGEQGARHMSCQGKLDKDSILQQLHCAEREDDSETLATETAENNQLPAVELTSTSQHKAPLVTRQPLLPEILEHDILTVVSNNDEDNNIDVNPNQIEDTVKNVINKFNLADLMQAEQSLHSEEVDGRFDGERGKDGKKAGGKKYSPLFEKKNKFGKKEDGKLDDEDELMMGDQPDETETQPIDIVQQAVKPTEGDSDESATSGVLGSSTEGAASSETTLTESTTVDSRLRRATDGEPLSESTPASTTEVTPSSVMTTTAEPTTSSSTASHILPTTPKKEISSVGDHFIPPMLLVKARFTSTKNHVETTSTTELVTTTSQTSEPAVSTEQKTSPTMTTEVVTTPEESTSVVSEVASSEKTSTSESDTTTVAHQIVEITFDDKELSTKIGTLSITTRPFTTVEETKSTTVSAQITTTAAIASSTEPVSTLLLFSTAQPTTTTTTTTPPAPPSSPSSSSITPKTTVALTSAPVEHEPQPDELEEDINHDSSDDLELDDQDHPHKDLHNSFSNIENYQPYKPNRRRTLTKPEVHSNHGNYIKKILG